MYRYIICFFSCFSLLPEKTEIHKQRGNFVVFSVKHSLPLCFVLPGLKFFPGLYKLLDAILVVTPYAYALHKSTFSGLHATHETSTGLPLKKHLHGFYLWKQLGILLCSLHNLCSIFAGASSFLPKESDAHYVMPPTLMWHVKGIFLPLSNTSTMMASS